MRPQQCVMAVMAVWALSGCGNKGKLYLPEDASLDPAISESVERALPEATSESPPDQSDNTEKTPSKQR